jgi:DNA recombination protein RmuC
VLKDVKMREQAGLIQKEVGLLLGDVDRLSGRVDNLKKHFGQATADIEQIVTSAGKITGRGEKIQSVELQDGTDQAKVAPPVGPALL